MPDDLTSAVPFSDDASPVRSFGFRLWHLRQAFTRRLDAALLPFGLTHMQYVMLRVAGHLGDAGEQPTQARLAEGTATDRMMVSKLVRVLEGKGLVARCAHPGDARAQHVALTEAGQHLVAAAVPVALRVQDGFFGRLGPAHMAQFGAMLDELLQLEGIPIAPCGILHAPEDMPEDAGAAGSARGADAGRTGRDAHDAARDAAGTDRAAGAPAMMEGCA